MSDVTVDSVALSLYRLRYTSLINIYIITFNSPIFVHCKISLRGTAVNLQYCNRFPQYKYLHYTTYSILFRTSGFLTYTYLGLVQP